MLALDLDDIQFRLRQKGENRMQCQENTVETGIIPESEESRTSKLAILSAAFGILGPFSAGAMWIASVNNFVIRSHLVMTILSCGVISLLGLLLATKSFEKIRNSEGHLTGREYAIVGNFTSAAWLLLISVGLLLPVIHSVNS